MQLVQHLVRHNQWDRDEFVAALRGRATGSCSVSDYAQEVLWVIQPTYRRQHVAISNAGGDYLPVRCAGETARLHGCLTSASTRAAMDNASTTVGETPHPKVHVCVCICMCVHTCVCVCMCVHLCASLCAVYNCIHMYPCECLCPCVHMHLCMWIPVYMYVCMYYATYVYMHACT